MSRFRTSAPRYRRRIFGLGMLAALVLFSIGFPIFNNRIEADLERRVPDELAEAGFPGITATFSGQDGTLRCAEPLTDPEAATAAAYDVWGVRRITLDRLCRVNRAPTVADGDDSDTASGSSSSASSEEEGGADISVSAAPEFDTVADAVASEPQLAFLRVLLDETGSSEMLADPANAPVTLFAPTDDAFEALAVDAMAQLRSDPQLLARVLGHHVVEGALTTTDLQPGAHTMLDGTTAAVTVDGGTVSIDDATIVRPDVVTGNGIVHVVDRVLLPPGFDAAVDLPAAVSATWEDGAITLEGVVASEVDRVAIVDAAGAAAGSDRVVDLLTVDPDIGLGGERAGQLATLVAAMPATLASGVAGFDGDDLYLEGVAVDDAALAEVEATADAVGASADVEVRPVADGTEAAELETELNEAVTANPIEFEPNSAVLSAAAAAVLDDLAARVLAVDAVTITVEGHTDSDGDAAGNLALSRRRAEAVRQALVDRGVAAASITAEGFGQQQPVLVAGVEDKDASRRVEFRIEATT